MCTSPWQCRQHRLPTYSGVWVCHACPAERGLCTYPYTLVLKQNASAQEAASWRDFRASLVHQERAGLFTIDDSTRSVSLFITSAQPFYLIVLLSTVFACDATA